MATTSIKIINAALTRAGNNQISSFTDGSAEALVANANYQVVVDDLLTAHPWRFAVQTAYLDKLTDDPLTDGQARFQIPNDVLRIITVSAGTNWYGQTLNYQVNNDTIVTVLDVERPVMTYIARISEPDWPAYFRELVVRSLHALFLRAINEDDRRADRIEEVLLTQKMPRARTIDGQQSGPRDKMQSQLLAARRGWHDPNT